MSLRLVIKKIDFIIDTTVKAFLYRHAKVRSVKNPETVIGTVLAVANQLAGEPVFLDDNLTTLSGGQARALMVGDVALIMALRFKAKLIMLHVMEKIPDYVESRLQGLLGEHQWESMVQAYENEARQKLIEIACSCARLRRCTNGHILRVCNR